MVDLLCSFIHQLMTVFVLGDDVTQHERIYPYVLIFYTLDDLEYCQLF